MKAVLLAISLLPALGWAERPAHWAEPVKGVAVQNWFRVSDGLYRCAQPTPAALQELEKAGIRTVINLRTFHQDEAPETGTALRLEHVRMQAWDVDEGDIVRVLALLRQKDQGPFLVHCQHGADRTGLVIAMHRIIDLGWSKEAALAEMRKGGFGYHKVWRNITRYVKHLDDDDVAKLRRRVDERVRKSV